MLFFRHKKILNPLTTLGKYNYDSIHPWFCLRFNGDRSQRRCGLGWNSWHTVAQSKK